MKRRNPDLIVPIRDRRQHKRYLTLRNARNVFIGLFVLFILITIRSEVSGPSSSSSSSYGRLLDRDMSPVESKPVEVVKEAAAPSVDDQTSADPMLVAPAAREQWLRDGSSTAAAVIEPIVPVAIAAPRGGGSKVAIVGGPYGVTVIEQKQRRPVLSGGFGR